MDFVTTPSNDCR